MHTTTAQTFTFEKNSGVYDSILDVSSFFTVQPGCSVNDYTMKDSMFKTIDSSHIWYTKYQLDKKVGPSLGPIKFETTTQTIGVGVYAAKVQILITTPTFGQQFEYITLDIRTRCLKVSSLSI